MSTKMSDFQKNNKIQFFISLFVSLGMHIFRKVHTKNLYKKSNLITTNSYKSIYRLDLHKIGLLELSRIINIFA